MKELFCSILAFAEWVSFAIDYITIVKRPQALSRQVNIAGRIDGRKCWLSVAPIVPWPAGIVRLLIGQPAAVIDPFFGQSTYNISEAYSSTGTKASLQVFKSFDTVGVESKWTQTESQRMRLG
ncbi:Kynurenine 3-monooxygenase [Trichinella pseudospiralis]